MMEPTTVPLRLGKQLKVYQRSGKAFLKIALLSLFSAAISALILNGAFTGRGIDLGGKIVLTILAVIFLLPTIAGAYVLFTRRGSSAILFENGLIYRYGKREFVAAWDDIESLTESSASHLELKNGEACDLGANLEGYDEIAQMIHEETLRRILPQVNAVLDRGGSVAFNGIQLGGKVPLADSINKTILKGDGLIVDAAGISTTDRSSRIRWEEVVDYGVRQGTGRHARFPNFYIQDENIELQMNYGTLKNGHVLLALCAERAPRPEHHEPS